MKPAAKPKRPRKEKQRFALQFERDVAQRMVEALRLRLLSGDNPQFDPKQNRDIPGVLTLGEVCHYLDQFSGFGTFGHEFSYPRHFQRIREAKIPGEFAALRTTKSYEEAVAELAEKYGCSERTVSTIVGSAK